MRALIALTLFAAVAAADERGLTVTPPSAELTLSLQVVARVRGVRHPVRAGETLHSGDRIELRVDVDQPAYVYVMQVSADGSSAVLFPTSGDLLLSPGVETRIPTGGQWFELDEHAGDEHVVVVASAQPIAQADEEAKRVLDEIRQPPALAAKVKKKPVALSLRTRGLVLAGGDDNAVRARSDKKGVAIFRFSFKHAR
jgi:hypothetical protein